MISETVAPRTNRIVAGVKKFPSPRVAALLHKIRGFGSPRRWVPLMLGLAVFLPLVVLPGVAEARTPGLYNLNPHQGHVTVRLNPSGFVIGNIADHDTFFLLSNGAKGSAYGMANGKAKLCGWVEEGHLKPTHLTGNHPRPACPAAKDTENISGKASRDYLLAHYASEVNDRKPGPDKGGKGCGIHLVGDRPLWGNVSGNSVAGPVLAAKTSAIVSWRYRVKTNPGIIMVRAHDGTWGFITVNPHQPLPHVRANGHCPPGATLVGL